MRLGGEWKGRACMVTCRAGIGSCRCCRWPGCFEWSCVEVLRSRWFSTPGHGRAAACCRYEFFADDLPIWGFVGPPPEQTKGDSNVYIYTHKSLDVAYNGNRVSLPEGWEFHNSASDSYMCLWHALVHTSIPGWSSVGGEESSG